MGYDVKLCKCGCGDPVKRGNAYMHGHNRRGRASHTSDGRWSVRFDRCQRCGTTKTKHTRDGYCFNCARKLLRSGELKRKRITLKGWSKKHDKCGSCGTVSRPHHAGGCCARCHARKLSRKKGAKKRYKWAVGYFKCRGCGTNERSHVSNGLCYDCYHVTSRKERGVSLNECPVCGVLVEKFNHHLAMRAKTCLEHQEVLTAQQNRALELFDSTLSSADSAEVLGVSKRFVLNVWRHSFTKEEVVLRGERTRLSKISGENHYLYGKKLEDIYKGRRTYPYKGFVFKSSWELGFVKYLDGLGVPWEYEKYRFLYTDTSGKERFYWPDFYLPDIDMFVEIKGFYTEADRHKVSCFIGCNPDKLIVLQEKELKNLGIL